MPLTEKGVEIKHALVKEYGPEKGERVLYAGKNKGTFTGIDSMAKDEVAMTASEVQKKNEDFWGNIGPAPSEESAPMLAGTKVGPSSIKVWHGAGVGDEVSPTQSAPADPRSDNLLERGHGGIPGTESLTGGSVPSPLAGDELVEGSEAENLKEHQTDEEARTPANIVTPQEHKQMSEWRARKESNKGVKSKGPGGEVHGEIPGYGHETKSKDLGIGEAVRTGRQIGEKVARGEMPIGVDA